MAANVTATTYEHTSPDADTNNYWVTACNAAGCSEIDSGNPARFVDNRPAAPTGAQYMRVGTTTVVTWDPSAGVTHYKVYYDDFFDSSCRMGSGGSPSFCEELAGNVSRHNLHPHQPGRRHQLLLDYRLQQRRMFEY